MNEKYVDSDEKHSYIRELQLGITVTNRDRTNDLSRDKTMNVTNDIYKRVASLIHSAVNETRLPREVTKENNFERIPL